MKIFPYTRQVTGKPFLHYAYVFDGNKVVQTCNHKHRKYQTALKCAKQMTARYLANQK